MGDSYLFRIVMYGVSSLAKTSGLAKTSVWRGLALLRRAETLDQNRTKPSKNLKKFNDSLSQSKAPARPELLARLGLT